jgi:hypothetical protein
LKKGGAKLALYEEVKCSRRLAMATAAEVAARREALLLRGSDRVAVMLDVDFCISKSRCKKR